MNLPWGDIHRPDRSKIIMVCFAYGSGQTAYTDAVTAHDRILCIAIRIQVLHVHGFCIFGSQLEDVSYFNTTGNLDCFFATFWTDTALNDLGNIYILCIRYIAVHAEACEVVFLFVGTTGKVVCALERLVIDHGKFAVDRKVYRSDIAGVETTFFGNNTRVHLLAQIVC